MSHWYKFNNKQKHSILYAVGYQPLKIIVNRTTTFDELRKIIKIVWGTNPTTLRLFLTNGNEISQNELQIMKQGQKLYATLNGSDLNANILCMNYSINNQLSKNLNSITLQGNIISSQAKVILKQININHFLKTEFAEFIWVIQKLRSEKMSKTAHIFEMLILERKGELWLTTEFCEGIQLNTLIQKKYQLGHVELQCLIRQICETVSNLHSRNIIIKNLKLENIFVVLKDHQSDVGMTFQIKLTDIGYNNQYRIRNQTEISSYNYYPSEIFNGETFSQASDIWALGIIIYYLYYHQFPFAGKTKSKILQNINELKYENSNDVINYNLKDLLKQIFTADSKSRISISSILDHPYFQKNRSNNNSISYSSRQLSLSVSRQSTTQNYRKISCSQRLDSEEQKHLTINDSIKVVGLQKDKSIFERRRCLSHFNNKKRK